MVRTEVFAFSGSNEAGDTNCVSGFALSGRQPFSMHRLSGGHELPQACSPLTGGEFFAEPQRGIRRRCGGNVPRPAAGECADAARAHKRVDTYGFHPLVNLPFPFDSLAQIADM